MELRAHGSLFAILAGLVLVWSHDVVGTITYLKSKGYRGPRGRISERSWQVQFLVMGILLLIGGLVSLLTYAL